MWYSGCMTTLDEILAKFSSPGEASECARLGRTAGYHWYAEGIRRRVPAPRTLIVWADKFELSDEDLGSLIRDSDRVRRQIMGAVRLYREERKRDLRDERSQVRERRSQRFQRGELLMTMLHEREDEESRRREWEEKEKYLETLVVEEEEEVDSPEPDPYVDRASRLDQLIAMSREIMKDL